jgi:murein L,D-transpeptidase YafK
MKQRRMKLDLKRFILLFFVLGLIAATWQNDFLSEQKRYERVRTAITEKESSMISLLDDNSIKIKEMNLLIVAYKSEGIMELYAKNKAQSTYKKIQSYSICASSGNLGPKRKMGDGQVPEGFYHIDRFNPTSNYYLSLGINYPNASDRKLSTASNLGGDIFIHGSCVTIGCMPMTDDKIKEIYLYAVHAKNNGQQKIPVYIFPFKMTEMNYLLHKKTYSTNKTLLLFWSKLKVGYDAFEANHQELKFTVNKAGDYCF